MNLGHARSMTVDIMVRGTGRPRGARKIFDEAGFRPSIGGRNTLLNL
jgi:hypothetical protein